MNETPSQRIPRTVWKLGWISFFADVSSEMAYPIIPLFLKNTLKASVGSLGIIEGTAEAIVSFMKGWSGWHSDRIGKRVPYIRWGYGLSAAGKPLIGLATVWPLVLVARVVDRLGKGLRTTARDALVADAVPKSMLGRAFGLHRGLDTAGALVGVLVAWWLVQLIPGNYRTIFLLAGIPGVASVILTFMIRERKAGDVEDLSQPMELTPLTRSPREVLRSMPPGYWFALVLTLLFALANSSDTFLLLRSSQLGLKDDQVIFVYALYNVAYMLLSYPAGLLSDKIGRWGVMGAGWILYVGVYAGFATLGQAALWPLFLLYGVYMGLTKGVGSALVADFAPKDARGTAMGLFNMLLGGATLLASLIAGILWDQIGPRAPFWFGSIVAAIAVLTIPFGLRFQRVASASRRQ